MEKRLLLKNKDNETSVAVFGVPSDKFNLQMAMKEAAAEYCRTEIGRRDFEKGMDELPRFYELGSGCLMY